MPVGLAGRVPLSVVGAGGKAINVLEPVLCQRSRVRGCATLVSSAALIYDHSPSSTHSVVLMSTRC